MAHAYEFVMCQDWWLTLCCNGSLEEALWYSEQRPVGVQRVDGWRRLQQLCIGIDLWHLQDTRSTWVWFYCQGLWWTWHVNTFLKAGKNVGYTKKKQPTFECTTSVSDCMLHLSMLCVCRYRECFHNTPSLFLGQRFPLVPQLLHLAREWPQSGKPETLETWTKNYYTCWLHGMVSIKMI